MRPAALLFVSIMIACTNSAQAAPLDNKVLEEAKDFLKKHLEYYNTGNIGLAKLYGANANSAHHNQAKQPHH